MYTGTLSYFAQLQAQHQLSAIAFKANIFPIFNTDPTNPTQAVSRVKALQLANAQGQQIYKIDQTNIDEVLPKLNLSSTIKQDIQSSVNAGKYVITHTDNVSVPGWSGAGYAVIDPLTGSDAYMISGGENGGFVKLINNIGGAFFSAGALIMDLFEVISRLSGAFPIFKSLFGSIGAYLNLANYFLDLQKIDDSCNGSLIKYMMIAILGAITLLEIILVQIIFLIPGLGMMLGLALTGILTNLIMRFTNKLKDDILMPCE